MRARPFPVATVGLVALMLGAFAVELGGGVEPFCLAHGFDPERPSFAGALASLFLHAGAVHLLGNTVALAMLGVLVESEIGAARLAPLFLAAGLAGCALHAFVAPSGSVLVGSSGAILGLLPLGMVLRPRALLAGGVCFVGMHLVGLFGVSGLFPAGVSLGDHVGGFFAGSLFVFARTVRHRSARMPFVRRSARMLPGVEDRGRDGQRGRAHSQLPTAPVFSEQW